MVVKFIILSNIRINYRYGFVYYISKHIQSIITIFAIIIKSFQWI